MKYATVVQNLQYLRDSLAPVIQMDNVDLHTGEKLVTWYGRVPGIYNRTYYPLEYQYLIDKQQYSLLLSDGSFFQFFYGFDLDETLQAARLAYYPPPIPTHEESGDLIAAAERSAEHADEFLFEHLTNCIELIDGFKIHPANTGHFRFDYDPTSAQAHAVSHLQFSGVNGVRVPASFFPLPTAFVQIVASAIQKLPILQAVCDGHAKNNALRLGGHDALISLAHQ